MDSLRTIQRILSYGSIPHVWPALPHPKARRFHDNNQFSSLRLLYLYILNSSSKQPDFSLAEDPGV
jgi:hypothetical protein